MDKKLWEEQDFQKNLTDKVISEYHSLTHSENGIKNTEDSLNKDIENSEDALKKDIALYQKAIQSLKREHEADKKRMLISLERMAIEKGYSRMKTIHQQEVYSKKKTTDVYDLFFFGIDQDKMNVAHIDTVLSDQLNQTVKHQAVDMVESPMRFGLCGILSITAAAIAGAGIGAYLGLNDPNTSALTNATLSILAGIGFGSVGMGVGTLSYGLKEILTMRSKKKKAAEHLEKYKNANLITYGADALKAL